MTSVYLHVGLPKTGATFLQQHCFPNLRDVHYAGKKANAPASGIVKRLVETGENYPHFVDMDATRAEVEEFVRGVSEDRLLLSDELLIGDPYWRFRDHAQMTAALHELLPSARVILTIRRQDDLLESLYDQCLRGYNSPSVDTFLDYNGHEFMDRLRSPRAFFSVNVWRYDYHVFAQNYAGTFGRDNVLVLPLELLTHDPVRYHTTIADFIGCEPFLPTSGTAVDEAYSSLSVRIALLLNRFVRVPRPERRFLRFIPHEPLTTLLNRRSENDRVDRLLYAVNKWLSLHYFLENVVDRLPGARAGAHLISDRKRQKIMEIHRGSNRRLDEEYKLGLKEYGYY